MDATTIVLPAAPAPPSRPSLPLLAAIVPVFAGLALWLITGSLFALCFAALGPLMLLASFFDGIRSRRREQRRAVADTDDAWQRAEDERRRLHAAEHAALWRRHPDAAGCLTEPPLRGHDDVARDTPLVVGRGERRSRVQATGGEDARARAFRDLTAVLPDAPIVVPLGGGVCVRAPRRIGTAVVRALVAQLCLRFGPAALGLRGEPEAFGLDGFAHAARRRATFRLGVDAGGGADDVVDATVCLCAPGAEPPDGITTVIDVDDPLHATVRTPEGVSDVAVEALSAQQLRLIAAESTQRAAGEALVPDAVTLAALSPVGTGGLPAVIGRGSRGDAAVDLVEDGPHAIVTGMTGTGKSELLTTWVTAMAAVRTPAEVSFVLVDFKGGTAFDPLRILPHVVAVVTDLDADGARRGVISLTAELRRREGVLAAAGVRDVRDCATLGRLVIVVDEFAALLQEHPDLGSVFTDVAARGRALGMHLILGTQRASGVIRDALAANCPLRISLRVSDAADSRLVIGSDAAADLPGGPDSRGLAFVRRPGDGEAQAVRVALTAESDLRVTARENAHVDAPSSPWLPPLPGLLPLAQLPAAGDGDLLLGLGDDPGRQDQRAVLLAPSTGLAVLGGPASGKSAVIRLLAAQDAGAVIVPDDLEGAWDAVAELSSGRHGLVLCDDLDVLLAGFPPEYAQAFSARWEGIVRSDGGAVVTLSRASGPLGRLIDALPRRALLRMSSRIEHIAAGGESGEYDRDRPAGRAHLDGLEMQFAWTDAGTGPAGPVGTPSWQPRAELSGVVTAATTDTAARLRAAHPDHLVIGLDEAAGAAGTAGPRIIVADPEQWRAQWTLTQLVRTTGEMVIAAECQGELRQLAGIRDLPPYARQHAGRAWVTAQGAPPRRVLLAG